jgi:hypothetical protein
MVAPGTLTDPDIVPLVPPSQIPVSVMLKLEELFAVNVLAGEAFAHPLPLTVTPLATILQITVPVAGEHVAVPGERRSIVALPLDTSTAVVLAEKSVHALLEVTQVLSAEEIVFVQPDQTGPAEAPPEFFVVAFEPDAVAYTVVVHVTDGGGEPAPFVVSVNTPVAGPINVPCGLQVTAEAEALAIAATDRTAIKNSPNFFVMLLCISTSLCRPSRRG